MSNNNTFKEYFPSTTLWLIALWSLLVFVPLFSRNFIQIDETRYVSVAWEMWQRGEWLVPHLNGEIYHHKPPLLFWLIKLGWLLFGVNEWWPRLISGLFSLACLGLTAHLAQQLWPQFPKVAQLAPFILLSCLIWSIFTSATMFDVLLTFWVLLGLIGLVRVWQWGPETSGMKILGSWGLFSLAIAGGILTKGPVIFLHLLPVALLARNWQNIPIKSSWYLAILGSSLTGAILALSWAIPAGLAGGEEYRQAIFWGQTAHRMVDSFAHQHPIWWYLPLLLLAGYPWTMWGPSLYNWKNLTHHYTEPSVRFILAWLLPVLLGFSLISGKQLHYLLPIFPAFTLLITYLTVRNSQPMTQPRWQEIAGITTVTLSLGSLFLGISLWTMPWHLPTWISALSPWIGSSLILIGLGISVVYRYCAHLSTRIILVSTVAIGTSLIIPLGLLKAAGPAYDLSEISWKIKELQEKGEVIAHLGDYHGQYQFLGRLQPLPVIDEYQMCTWLLKHPDSYLIFYFPRHESVWHSWVSDNQYYRSHYVGILPAQMLSVVCLKSML